MSQKDQASEKVQNAFKKCEFALWLLRKKNYQKSMLYSQILDIFFTFSYENQHQQIFKLISILSRMQFTILA